MIGRIVQYAAILASAFVTLSFLFFAANQTSTASQNQVKAISGGGGVEPEKATKVPNPPRNVERVREKENDGFHEFVDDVDDVLLAPFTGIFDSDNIWVKRLIPLGLALLIYGLGGMYLARALGLRRW